MVLADISTHHHGEARGVKVFTYPCPTKDMCCWMSKVSDSSLPLPPGKRNALFIYARANCDNHFM